MDEWSDAELSAAVEAYQGMARFEAASKPYNKREIYRDLAARFGRTDKAFEYRMQNISAVLHEMGKDWIPGLKPAGNVGSNIKPRIVELLARPIKVKVAGKGAEPDYKAKLPAMRDWLIEVARHQGTVTYGDVMDAFGIGHRNLRRSMDYLGHQSDNRDEPIITALIVSPKDGKCSEGFAKEFGVNDDAAERKRLYEFWIKNENEPEPVPPAPPTLEVKAARFVSVEARPDQAAFRRAVFLACVGKCVISGCDIVKALDAAHKHGRDWRKGHNKGEDGYLLRKDLHALYDNMLLSITEQGTVELHPSVTGHYGHYVGQVVNLTND